MGAGAGQAWGPALAEAEERWRARRGVVMTITNPAQSTVRPPELRLPCFPTMPRPRRCRRRRRRLRRAPCDVNGLGDLREGDPQVGDRAEVKNKPLRSPCEGHARRIGDDSDLEWRNPPIRKADLVFENEGILFRRSPAAEQRASSLTPALASRDASSTVSRRASRSTVKIIGRAEPSRWTVSVSVVAASEIAPSNIVMFMTSPFPV